MAVLSTAAIRTALAETLDGTITSGVREITVGLATNDLMPGASDETAALRALVTPQCSVSLSWFRHEARPAGYGPAWIDGLRVVVRTTHLLKTQALGRLAYDTIRVAADDLGYRIRARFEEPGALTTTSAAVATGIVSGVLMHESTSVIRDDAPKPDQQGGGLYELEHTFTGAVFTVATVA